MVATEHPIPPPHTWRDTPQARAVADGIDAAGMTYLTHRQVDVILDALKAGGHLAEPATVDNHEWTHYTPDWTSDQVFPQIGNGDLVGKYRLDPDDGLHLRVRIRPGTSGGRLGTGTMAVIATVLVKEADTFPRERLASLLAAAAIVLAGRDDTSTDEEEGPDHGHKH